jgi:2-C-methyl-D-erythritol 4-phosphate cytidylyltransferase
LIQDGARPFLTAKLIEDGLEAARETGAAIAAVPVTDTLKQADESNHVALTLDRRQIRAVQTPQVFSYDIIVEAYEKATGEVTDDAMLAEQAGYKVKMYMGNYNNIKVTRPEDMKLAEFIAAGR